VSTVAFAYWTVTGSGSGSGGTAATAQPLTLSPGTPTQRAYPGGVADVAVTVANPNPFPVRVSSLSLDTGQGTVGFAVDGGHSTCGVSSLGFLAQSNAGLGWIIPPKVGAVNGSRAIDLVNALTMTVNAANACQGASFTVYLTATADYNLSIMSSSSLVGYWRLGDNATVADSFTGTVDTALTAHGGEAGASWAHQAGSTTAVLTDQNRVRRIGTGMSLDYPTATLSSQDYAVEADLYVRSNLAGDRVGVVGRMNTAAATYYLVQYQQADNGFHLYKVAAGGAMTALGCWCPGGTPTVGTTFRVRLDMSGTTTTTLKVYVDGVLRQTATDSSSPYTAPGRAGIQDGETGLAADKTNSTGIHLDNFRVVANTGTSVTDSKGANHGSFVGSPLLNEPGTLAGDLNRSIRWDGSSTYATVPHHASLNVTDGPFTLEAWVRRLDNGTGMQTILDKGAGSYQWAFSNNRMGLFKDGGSVIVQTTTTQTDTTGFHHYVVTKNGSAVKLYVDGVDVTGTVTDSTLANTTSPLTMGSKGGSADFLNGVQDEVAIYGSVLSPQTIADHYHIAAGS
jgi:hypothetical protein